MRGPGSSGITWRLAVGLALGGVLAAGWQPFQVGSFYGPPVGSYYYAYSNVITRAVYTVTDAVERTVEDVCAALGPPRDPLSRVVNAVCAAAEGERPAIVDPSAVPTALPLTIVPPMLLRSDPNL